MPLSIQDFKIQNPDYKDVPDDVLADKLYTKYYADKLPKEEFYTQVGVTKEPLDTGIGAEIDRIGASALGEVIPTVGKGIASIPMGVADMVRAGGAKISDAIAGDNVSSNIYETSKATQVKQNFNRDLAQGAEEINKATGKVHIPIVGADIGGGDVANMTGQAIGMAAPVKLAGMVGGAVTEAATSKVLPAWLSKAASWLTGSASAGATAGGLSATDGSTPDEVLNERSHNAKIGAVTGPIIEGGAKLIGETSNMASSAVRERTYSGAKDRFGRKLNETLSPEEMKALETHTATPKDARKYDLTTAEVTLNPELAKMQRETAAGEPVSSKTSSLELAKVNQANKAKLASEVEAITVKDANPTGVSAAAETQVANKLNEIKAPVTEAEAKAVEADLTNRAKGSLFVRSTPTEVEASKATAKSATDVANAKNNEIKSAYTNIDPDKVIPIKVNTTNVAVGKVSPEVKKAFIQEDGSNLLDKYTPKGSNPNEAYLSNKTGDVSSEIKPTAGHVVEDNAKLTQIMDDRIASTGDYHDPVYLTAKNIKQSLNTDLEAAIDVPSATGKSVGDAAKEAKQKFIDYQRNFKENTELSPVTQEGKEYGYAKSAFGEFDARLNSKRLDDPATEGRKLLPVQDAGAFDSSLRNVKNFPDKSAVVNNQILGTVSNKIKSDGSNALEAFDSVYSKDVQNSMVKHGFGEEHNNLLKIRDDLAKAKNNLGQQQDILAKAKEVAETQQKEFDLSAVSKLTKLPKDKFVDGILKDNDLKSKALELAKSQDDNGASLRGLGQMAIDKIKATIKPTEGVSGKTLKAFDHEEFQKQLDAHADLLKETVPDQYADLTIANDIGKRLEYVNNYSRPEGSQGQSEVFTNENLADIGLKEAGIKTGLYSTVINGISRVFKSISKENAVRVRAELTDPDVAMSLIKAAKESGDKGVTNWFDHKLSGQGALGFEVIQDKSLDKQVKAVLSSTKKKEDNSNNVSKKSNINRDNNRTPAGKSIQVGPQSSNGSTDNTTIFQGTTTQKTTPEVLAAAKTTGMPLDYFHMMANSETKGHADPDNAKNPAKGSTATGRYQFTERTWNAIAEKHSLPKITPENDPRTDPKLSALAVGYLGKDNKEQISKVLDREVTYSDIAMAHKFGVSGFKQLMKAPSGAAAASILPDAVKGNESLFFDAKGRARSVRQLYALVEKTLS